MAFLNKGIKPIIKYLHSSKHISFLITAKKKLIFIPFGASNNIIRWYQKLLWKDSSTNRYNKGVSKSKLQLVWKLSNSSV